MIKNARGATMTPKKFSQGVIVDTLRKLTENWKDSYLNSDMTGREATLVDTQIRKELARLEKKWSKKVKDDAAEGDDEEDEEDPGAEPEGEDVGS